MLSSLENAIKFNQAWESKISGLAPTRLNDEMAWRGWRGPRRRPRLPVLCTGGGGLLWHSSNVKGNSWNTWRSYSQANRIVRKHVRAAIAAARPETEWWKEERGILEDSTEEGTPQGGIVSPLLANLYLHEVLDLWIERDVKPRLRGSVREIRYADDAVLCFSNEEDARRVYAVLGARFQKYGLELHPEKTKLTDMRRKPQESGGWKQTFDFLGFTIYWGKSRAGHRTPEFKTAGKRLSKKLKEVGELCRRQRHKPMAEQQAKLRQVFEGHQNYFGVSSNSRSVNKFRRGIERVWLKWLNRRGGTLQLEEI